MILARRWPIAVALLCSLTGLSDRSLAQAIPPASITDAGGALNEAIRLYGEFNYAEAIRLLDSVIGSAASDPGGAQWQDVLTRAYEYRARARQSSGKKSSEVESDFEQLLKLRPDYELRQNTSPTTRNLFEKVKKRLVGRLLIQVKPPTDISIDGRTYGADPDRIIVATLAGDHHVGISKIGYEPVEQTVAVAPGDIASVVIELTRTSATFLLSTVPGGVDVFLDGVRQGSTKRSDIADVVSEPFRITGLQVGHHTLRYQRACYKPLERVLQVEALEDKEQREPVRLEPAVAKIKLTMSEPGPTVLLDGVPASTTRSELAVCEGEHLIDVRSARGRWMDRRNWHAGDAATLNPVIRPAFAIVMTVPPAGTNAADFTKAVESTLAAAKGALVFAPIASDAHLIEQQAGTFTPAFFAADSDAAVSKRRDATEKLATALNAQGIAGIESSNGSKAVRLSLLAAGSASPDVFTFDLNDAQSRAWVVSKLVPDLPPLVQTWIPVLLVDVEDSAGPVVVRTWSDLGLAPGDTITHIDGTATATVAQFWRQVQTRPGQQVQLTVRSVNGATKTVAVIPGKIPDAMSTAETGPFYNGVMLRLQEMVRETTGPVENASVRLNLALVEMRLGRWREASERLQQLQLPDGPGIAAATVAYLRGRCYEALGLQPQAREMYTIAAKNTEAMLSMHGPKVGPLAQERLQALGSR
ncbi:MAG TPA: PEGA domain-containing protein [Vicinamibacterales bacterium]|nr:PEGA domain-containing protein [Vicinamibacterales bacterium]